MNLMMLVATCLPALASASAVDVTNSGFESAVTGWTGATAGTDVANAPPQGTGYARVATGATAAQTTSHTIVEGEEYTLRVYARDASAEGIDAGAAAVVGLTAGGSLVASTSTALGAPTLKGAAVTYTNDDGANVWFDGDYRMQAAVGLFYQLKSADPIADPWSAVLDDEDELIELPYPANYAPGVVVTPQGVKALFGTAGAIDATTGVVTDACITTCDECEFEGTCAAQTECTCRSAIIPTHLTGTPPAYGFSNSEPIIVAFNNPFPSPLDANLFYDAVRSKLWMVWGGWTMFLTELDPTTAKVLGPDGSPVASADISTHPAGTHTPVMSYAVQSLGGQGPIPEDFDGYMEGPAIYKHNGYWYVFGSYGDLSVDYTIRVCRNEEADPRQGSFTDKLGRKCTHYDAATADFGQSMVLAGGAGQAVPGHPHTWQEGEVTYMGYDWRPPGVPPPERDWMGIRVLDWVDGWPTVWKPIEVKYTAGAADAGKALGVSLASTGGASTVAGFDAVTLTATAATPTAAPTAAPTLVDPTAGPTATPTNAPTAAPAAAPTATPTATPTTAPVDAPTRDEDDSADESLPEDQRGGGGGGGGGLGAGAIAGIAVGGAVCAGVVGYKLVLRKWRAAQAV